jgi:hypothetical protein
MPTISVKITHNEAAAIREYSRMCEESASDLIRKIVIQEITFMKNRSQKDPVSYEYHMLVQDTVSAREEKVFIEANYNKIRDILGWKKISLEAY